MAKVTIYNTTRMSFTRAQELAVPHIQLFQLYDGSQHAAWSTDVATDIEFVNNVQWTQDVAEALESDNQPVTTNNEIKPIRDQVIGQLSENSPRWLASPRENSDAQLAGDLSDFMFYLWGESNGDMHFRKSLEDFEDTGLFVMHSYYDPNADSGNGEIKVIRISPQKWFADPYCDWRNAQNADHQFIADVLSVNRIKALYPDFDFEGASAYKGDIKRYGTGSIQDGQIFQAWFLDNTSYYRIIDHYERVKVDMFKVYDPNSNFERTFDKKHYIEFAQKPAIILTRQSGEKIVTEEVQVKDILNLVAQNGNVYYEMSDGSERPGAAEGAQQEVSQNGQLIQPIPGSTTKVNIVTMNDLLHQGLIKWDIVPVDRIKRSLIIGEKLYREMLLPISNYPFAVTMLHHTDNPFPYGDARLARSIQEQINKINSIIIAYNINLSAMRAFLPKDGMNKKDLETRYGKAGAQFFEFDPEVGGVPIVMQMQQMSNSFYTQLDRLRALLQRIYGAYDFQEGQMSPAPQTASGTMQVEEMGMRRSHSKLQLIEQALNDLGGVIAELIPHVYTEQKLIRVLKPNNNKYKTVIFNQQVAYDDITKIKNDLTVNRYDINMVSSSTLPTNRAAKFNAYLRLFELHALKNPTPLLRLTDLPDIDEVIQNEDMLNQAMQYIKQLEQTMKSLKGDLQTASREKVHSDQKVQLAKTKADLDALVSKANAGVMLGQQRISDTVKDFKRKANETLNNINQPNSETSSLNMNANESQGDNNAQR